MGLIRNHPDFRRLWAAQTISEVGSQVSLLAVPLIAIVSLRASTFQAAALVAAGSAAFLVVGLPAGAWVDRMHRRWVMVAADVIRAMLLVSIPIAEARHVLTMLWLYAVVFGIGVCGVFFDVSNMAYLPAVVGRDALVAGNGRLEISRSVAYATGPWLAGLLIRTLTAPIAVIADALSFAWSAAWLSRISAAVKEPEATPRAPMRRQVAEGFRVILANPILRAMALYNTTVVMFWSLERAIQTIFLVRTVGLNAGTIGILYGTASLGAVAGGFTASRLAARLGTIRSMVTPALLCNMFMLLVPMTGSGWRLAFFVVGTGVTSCFVVAFNVVSMSYRQGVCPDHLLGRMNATFRFLSWGSLPVGSLLGGWVAEMIGIRPTLWIAASGGLLGVAWLLGIRPRLQRTMDRDAEIVTVSA